MQAGLDDVSVMVVGNKADLEDLRVVPQEAAAQVPVMLAGQSLQAVLVTV